MPSIYDSSVKNFIAHGSKCKYPAGLYLVATPIGNMEDITLRALFALEKADFIACEDTRITNKLLSHYGIHKPLIIYNDSAGGKSRSQIMHHLREGKRVALVSDAGMPLISDPGYKLVQQVLDEEIYVTCIPGPSASLAALLLSGIPSDTFTFQGFFPRKEKEALTLIENLESSQTFIFYESPKRLEKTLSYLAQPSNIEAISVARELTKAFEQVIRGTPQEVQQQLPNFPLKGEMVLIVRTKEKKLSQEDIDGLLIKALVTQGVKGAVIEVMALTGLPKNQLYQRALELNRS